MNLVLASKSPRRAWLLQSAGLSFRVVVAGVEETRRTGESPPEYALRLAREKRDAVVPMVPGAVVLAADTVVALGEDVLEKPRDAADAAVMLRRLSAVEHAVHTAVAAAGPAGAAHRVVTARVRFRPLSDEDISRYVATGEPLDKAGAYGIQGDGGALVDEVHGSYTTVVGLPLREALELIAGARGP
ncbi:MAG: septum formation inhibitor Maf [Deltaproteobacteria bacterium]|nr:septum formation inhibitor Maf [Deltaproteobacteria bacterium]